jgi:glycosyltransferase involved in cell wall biosynthesis
MSDGVLFVHNNFPGQFVDLAQALVARGVRCMAIGSNTASELPGVTLARGVNRKGTTQGIFPLAVRAEADLIRAYAAYEAARALKAQGFDPKLIIGHPGWGETVLLKEIFPDARQILFHEFYYAGHGLDIGFDPEFGTPPPSTVLAGTTKNAVVTLALSQADAIVTPTPFQASTLPPIFRAAARIIHEGVDVQTAAPGAPAPFEIPDGPTIHPGAPVITHVNRNLEPLRGLHILLRALPRLQAEDPEVQTIIVGHAERRAYGGAAPDGKTWKDVALERAGDGLDLSRVHFTGALPRDRMLAALRLSTAHVYYTYPFVLSWSLAEALACGAYVVGSDTAPVRDAVEDGVNGRLLPFFDVEALSGALIDACRNPGASAPLRAAARKTAVERFDQLKGRAAWLDLIREVAGI